MDKVLESRAGNGVDRVLTATSYSLGSGAAIEVLMAQDPKGSGWMRLEGNRFSQTIIGNAGKNVIDGGAGQDRLSGGAGQDTFVFSTALGETHADKILDFEVGLDRIGLDQEIFERIGSGTLDRVEFVSNYSGRATDSDDRIVHEIDTGRLYYDRDGNGSAKPQLFADLADNLSLSNADFFRLF